jgi:DivIVA domain-containing protein
LSGEEVRRATFPQALRGYDRQAVHDMLDRVADWMEGTAGAVSSATPGVREEFAKVGERTAGILNAAEEAARNLRDEAVEYAERLRADADDEARKARLNASQKMDEMVADAETKAQKIIDDAIARRRQLNLAISSLIDRRDEIAADATKLAEELLGAVEDLRSPTRGGEPVDLAPEPAEPESAEEEILEPEPEPESAEEEILEPESEEGPTLLVDPDAEDETPPHGNAT